MIVIKAEFTIGESARTCAEESIQLAKKLGVCVEFDFNGVTCMAFDDSDPKRFEDLIVKMVSEKTSRKFAATRGSDR